MVNLGSRSSYVDAIPCSPHLCQNESCQLRGSPRRPLCRGGARRGPISKLICRGPRGPARWAANVSCRGLPKASLVQGVHGFSSLHSFPRHRGALPASRRGALCTHSWLCVPQEAPQSSPRSPPRLRRAFVSACGALFEIGTDRPEGAARPRIFRRLSGRGLALRSERGVPGGAVARPCRCLAVRAFPPPAGLLPPPI